MEKARRQTLVWWFTLVFLACLCGVLALFQYRWIGQVSRAERERLGADLRASLVRLSREFNLTVNRAAWSMMPSDDEIEHLGRDAAYAARYARWRAGRRHTGLFRRLGVAAPEGQNLRLRMLDRAGGSFQDAAWPSAWNEVREHLLSRLQSPAPPPPMPETGLAFELPRFGRPRGDRPARFVIPEQDWLILELDLDYARDAFLPGLLQRHLGRGGRMDYEAEVVARTEPAALIYPAAAEDRERIGSRADASVTLFDIFREPAFHRSAEAGVPVDMHGSAADSGHGRWQLLVRRRGDSLDAVVAHARWLNLGISGAILVLILASMAALIRFTRQTQRLAQLQMNFVAGVSHELRTPLAVIGTAAYNLRDRVAHDPRHVEQYGELIQKEAGKLTAIVEQVLRFAGAAAGHVVRRREPISPAALVKECLQSSRAIIDEAGCVVEEKIEPGLPPIAGDAGALKHAVENLLHNAVKYGSPREKWIGVYASRSTQGDAPAVEIRVADRGPGVPEEERNHIFEPFFRGRQAVENQVRGTGLGLNLVKRIVEAHRGAVSVENGPVSGAEFVIRIPAATNGIPE
ncbi:MAG: HAMP domain-containing histidine kinase [Bryobacteraceae bacterium]|nr:HAMP domain-containing histidine kinase [Bryobacteraceae bacterium]